MKKIQLHAYAKINLTLDVTGKRPNGYHDVEMIMQQISLCDEVTVSWEAGSVRRGKPGQTAEPDPTGIQIQLTVSRPDLPADSSNLAWKAAEEMIAEFGGPAGGNAKTAAGTDAAGGSSKAAAGTNAADGVLTIDIQKQIPMAAGLAGGSSNCAAVLHAINQLWELNLSVKELCRIGARLGSDVPFCIMGQAAAEKALQGSFADDPDACHCALATGTGTDLKPLTGLDSFIVLSKPAIGVSTAEVYRGIDNEGIPRHPDNAVAGMPAIISGGISAGAGEASDLFVQLLTTTIVTLISFLAITVGCSILMRILVHPACKRQHRGLLHTSDRVLGLLTGLVEGVLLVFLFLALLMVVVNCGGEGLAGSIVDSLDSSFIAGALYDSNLLLIVTGGFFS